MKAGKQFEQTEWTVEEDEECKKLVGSAGGELHGFNFARPAPVHWASVTGTAPYPIVLVSIALTLL